MREIMTSHVGEEIIYRGTKFAAKAVLDHVIPRVFIGTNTLLEKILDGNPNDPITYNDGYKRLGVIIAEASKTPYQFYFNNRITLYRGDSVVDIHLPPVGKKDRSLIMLRHSFEMLAEYIRIHNLKPKYITGVTYERLALASQRYGFVVVDYPFSSEKRDNMRKQLSNYERVGLIKSPTGEIRLLIQPVEDFMRRFGKAE